MIRKVNLNRSGKINYRGKYMIIGTEFKYFYIGENPKTKITLFVKSLIDFNGSHKNKKIALIPGSYQVRILINRQQDKKTEKDFQFKKCITSILLFSLIKRRVQIYIYCPNKLSMLLLWH